MKMTLEEQTPVLDMDIPVTLKGRDLIKLNQILSRTYDEEEALRETLGPILQEIKMVIHEIEANPEWTDLRKWDSGLEALEKSVKKQKKHLKRIKKALVKKQNLRISYSVPGSGEVIRSTLIPMDLWESEGLWLLRAYSYFKGEEQTFRLDRILKLKEKAPGKRRSRPAVPAQEEDAFYDSEAETTAETEAEVEVEVTELADLDLEMDSLPNLSMYSPEDLELVTEAPEEDSAEDDPAEDSDEDSGESDEDDATPEGDLSPPEHGAERAAPGARHPHYSLPGKIPPRSGLPHRLERLIKRVERKSPDA